MYVRGKYIPSKQHRTQQHVKTFRSSSLPVFGQAMRGRVFLNGVCGVRAKRNWLWLGSVLEVEEFDGLIPTIFALVTSKKALGKLFLEKIFICQRAYYFILDLTKLILVQIPHLMNSAKLWTVVLFWPCGRLRRRSRELRMLRRTYFRHRQIPKISAGVHFPEYLSWRVRKIAF